MTRHVVALAALLAYLLLPSAAGAATGTVHDYEVAPDFSTREFFYQGDSGNDRFYVQTAGSEWQFKRITSAQNPGQTLAAGNGCQLTPATPNGDSVSCTKGQITARVR